MFNARAALGSRTAVWIHLAPVQTLVRTSPDFPAVAAILAESGLFPGAAIIALVAVFGASSPGRQVSGTAPTTNCGV